MSAARVVVTGLGLVTSIGHTVAEVTAALREGRHGLRPFAPFAAARAPVVLAGTLEGFDTSSPDQEDWVAPEPYRFRRETRRGMAPHVLYAHCAMEQALADAGLRPEDVAGPETGLYTASAGSPFMTYRLLRRVHERGVMSCPPLGIVSSAVGTLSFNLAAHYRIEGASCGFASACASSAHALGLAWEEVAAGRQARMIVVGAEDVTLESILPFASMRALSVQAEPALASRPFDRGRDGFVGSGGAAVLVLETREAARARGARIWGEVAGWGQAADGHSVATAHPEGRGLARAMERALVRAGCAAAEVDHVNAHATSTPAGDAAEARALRQVFGERAAAVAVAATKGLTGHAISAAGAMEAAFVFLAMRGGFTPGNPHLVEPDAACAGLHLPRATLGTPPRLALSNSSGFGGACVTLVLRAAEESGAGAGR